MQANWPVTREVRMSNDTTSKNSAVLAQAFLGLREATPKAGLTIPLGKRPVAPERTRMAYLLPFEIVSVHLLVVLIGAAYLARAKRRRGTVA
jgi:NADH-quinone oxidoreductase subunit J